MTFESIAATMSEFCHRHCPAFFDNSGAFTLIAAYIAATVVLYFMSERDKGFLIAGYAGLLFFVPFIKI